MSAICCSAVSPMAFFTFFSVSFLKCGRSFPLLFVAVVLLLISSFFVFNISFAFGSYCVFCVCNLSISATCSGVLSASFTFNSGASSFITALYLSKSLSTSSLTALI